MENQIQKLKESRAALDAEFKALEVLEVRSAEQVAKMSELVDSMKKVSTEIDALEQRQKMSFDNARIITNGPTPEERDLAKYDASKVLRAAAAMAGGLPAENALNGLELEMHQEAVNEMRNARVQPQGGAIIPSVILNHRGKQKLDAIQKRAAIAVGSSGSPGEAWGGVATDVAPWVAALWAQGYMGKLGITPMTGLVGELKTLRSGTSTFTFKTETATAADGNPDNDYFTLTPHRLPGYIDVTKQALIEWPGASGWVMDNIEQGILAALQKSIVQGAGSSGDLTGLLSLGVTQYYAGGAGTTSGTNPDGAALVYADFVNMMAGVAGSNVNPDNVQFLINSAVMGKAFNVVAFSNIQAPLIANGNVQNIGRPYVVSNHVPSNLTKGSGTALSAMICGDFSGAVVGQWGGIEILPDPYTQATAGSTRFHVSSFWDFNVKQLGMFTKMKDIVTA